MILGISIINNFGKCRFMKLYQKHMPEQQQQIMVKELFQTLNTRPDGVCNFLDASKWFDPGARIVYRQYATLFFIFAIDASESELGILDLIQVLVEALDRNFKNVCELDIIFNVEQVHWVVDEMVVGGMVAETNMNDILDAVESQARLARQEGVGNGGPPGPNQPPSF
mmetsp:Transcript_17739/g.39963  ORF Transcript_17739/g.39963 Transcript_17739/m.39963 type:complete len:168 (+) Transcript_17739:110-613(+)